MALLTGNTGWRAALVAGWLACAVPALAGQWVSHTFADGQVWADVAGVELASARSAAGHDLLASAQAEPVEARLLVRGQSGLEGPASLSSAAARAVQGLERQLERTWWRATPPSVLWPRAHYRLFNPGLDQWGFKGVPPPLAPIHSMPGLRFRAR